MGLGEAGLAVRLLAHAAQVVVTVLNNTHSQLITGPERSCSMGDPTCNQSHWRAHKFFKGEGPSIYAA